jgi:hypothetical protein
VPGLGERGRGGGGEQGYVDEVDHRLILHQHDCRVATGR